MSIMTDPTIFTSFLLFHLFKTELVSDQIKTPREKRYICWSISRCFEEPQKPLLHDYSVKEELWSLFPEITDKVAWPLSVVFCV